MNASPIARRPDWRARLAAYLRAQDGEAFAWGVRDCGAFCGGAVAAMTDVDPAADWVGRYACARSAMRLIKRRGHASLAEAWSAALPQTDAPQTGDLGMIEARGLSATIMGVIVGGNLIAPRRRARGVEVLALAAADRFWAV